MRTRRKARAYALLAAGATMVATAAVGVAAGSASAADEPGSGFLSLGLQAYAGGTRFIVSEEASGQPAGFAEADIPYAETRLTRVNGRALSSVAWPGTAAANLGSFYALLQGKEPPVNLNDPVRAEAQTGSGDNHVENNLPGGSMSADATLQEVRSRAQMGGSSNVTVGTFGTTRVDVRSAVTGVSTAETEARTLTEDAHILSPAGAAFISIGSVASHAQATTDGTAVKTGGKTTVTDMKVAGIPVYVDKDGVHARGTGIGTGAATEALSQALAQTQTEIFLSEPHTTTAPNGVTYDAGSLFISLGDGSLFVILGGARVVAGSTLSTAYVPPTTPVPTLGPTQQPLPPGGDPLPPTQPGVGLQPGAGPAPPQGPIGPGPTVPQTAFAGNPVSLPGGWSPGWIVLVVLGVGFIAGGLRWLPTKLLEDQPSPCPLGEKP